MRRLWILGACGIAFLGSACEPVETYNPTANSNTPRTNENCSQSIADAMGIDYTVEDGATERLAEFTRRVRECVNG